jgi:hypothetical protein
MKRSSFEPAAIESSVVVGSLSLSLLWTRIAGRSFGEVHRLVEGQQDSLKLYSKIIALKGLKNTSFVAPYLRNK